MIVSKRFLHPRLFLRSLFCFAEGNPKQPRSPANPGQLKAELDLPSLKAILTDRSVNKVLKNPVPVDTVHNPIFNLRLSINAAKRIRGFVGMKIALWGAITGLFYYFISNPLWCIVPAVLCLSNVVSYYRSRNFVNIQVRRMTLLNVNDSQTQADHIRIVKYDGRVLEGPISEFQFGPYSVSDMGPVQLNHILKVIVKQGGKQALLSFPPRHLLLTNAEVLYDMIGKKKKSFPDIKILDAPPDGYPDNMFTPEHVEEQLKIRKAVEEAIREQEREEKGQQTTDKDASQQPPPEASNKDKPNDPSNKQ